MIFDKQSILRALGHSKHRPGGVKKYQRFVLHNIKEFNTKDWTIFMDGITCMEDQVKAYPAFWKVVHSYLIKELGVEADSQFPLRTSILIDVLLDSLRIHKIV